MRSPRHAYLILAHTNFNQLIKLLGILDHPLNDIYVHIDIHSSDFDQTALLASVKDSSLSVSSSYHLAWGSETMIDGMLYLLKAASQTEHLYYHLISGMDLPLQPQSEIHAFFQARAGAEFIDFQGESISALLLADRIQTYHFLQAARERYPIFRAIDQKLLRLQTLLRVNRLKHCGVVFQKGSQWFSITHDFALYCLSNAPAYRPYFRFSKCGDELFFQTLLQNSPFLSNRAVQTYNDNRATMRLIDWDRGNGSSPYVFRAADYDEITQSGMLFARKFDETVDAKIIERIAAYVFAQSSCGQAAHEPNSGASPVPASGGSTYD